MKTSKNIAIITVLIILIAAGAVVFNMYQPKQDPEENNQENTTPPQTYSVTGEITKVEDGRIEIEVPVYRVLEEGQLPTLVNEIKGVTIFENVKIMRWNTNTAGAKVRSVVTPSALRVGMEVNVSTTSDPTNATTFVASQIEINQ